MSSYVIFNPIPYHSIICRFSVLPVSKVESSWLYLLRTLHHLTVSNSFSTEFPGPFNSFSNFPSSKEIASWSVRSARIISFNSTKSLKLLDINQWSRRQNTGEDFWLHVELFASGFLDLQISIKSNLLLKSSTQEITDFLFVLAPPFFVE